MRATDVDLQVCMQSGASIIACMSGSRPACNRSIGLGWCGMPSGREPRYVAEYVMTRFPRSRAVFNVPLGAVPAELVAEHGAQGAAARFRPFRPRIDALVWDGGGLILLEGEIDTPRNGISDLLFYRPLVDQTPELAEAAALPRRLLLVIPWLPDWLQHAASSWGLEVEVYAPAWMADHVRKTQEYHTQPWRERRAARAQVLRAQGLD